MTRPKKWAMERNRDKFRATGIEANLTAMIKNSRALTMEERRELTEIAIKLKGVLRRWPTYNVLSKQNFIEET